MIADLSFEEFLVLHILRSFDFLRGLGYHASSVSSNPRAPGVTYSNNRRGMTVYLSGEDLKWSITIRKQRFLDAFTITSQDLWRRHHHDFLIANLSEANVAQIVAQNAQFVKMELSVVLSGSGSGAYKAL